MPIRETESEEKKGEGLQTWPRLAAVNHKLRLLSDDCFLEATPREPHFAGIGDAAGGIADVRRVYQRVVGPVQIQIMGTWRRWGGGDWWVKGA